MISVKRLSVSTSPLPAVARRSNQVEPHLAAKDFSGALQGGKRHVSIGRIKQAANLAAARTHALGQAFAGKLLVSHCLFNLPSENLFNRHGLKSFARPLL